MHGYPYYAGIYALLQLCALISLLLLAITLWVIVVKRAGTNIHQQALRTLIKAPLHFFTNTDTGVITNLFSQDLNLIDTELPEATLNTLFSVSLLFLDIPQSLQLHQPLIRAKSYRNNACANLMLHSQVFQSLGQAAVILTSSIYLIIAYPFLGAILYFVGRFYLRTSRQLRLLDLEAKSPL